LTNETYCNKINENFLSGDNVKYYNNIILSVFIGAAMLRQSEFIAKQSKTNVEFGRECDRQDRYRKVRSRINTYSCTHNKIMRNKIIMFGVKDNKI